MLNLDKICFSPVSPVNAFHFGEEDETESLYLRRGTGVSAENLILHFQGKGNGVYNEEEIYFHRRVHFIDGFEIPDGALSGDSFADGSISADKLAPWIQRDVNRIIPNGSITAKKLKLTTNDTLTVNISGNAATATNADMVDGKHASDFVLESELASKVAGLSGSFATKTDLAKCLMASDAGQVEMPSILRLLKLDETTNGGFLWLQNAKGGTNSAIYNYNTAADGSCLILRGNKPDTAGKGTESDNAIGAYVGPTLSILHDKGYIDVEAENGFRVKNKNGTLTLTPTKISSTAKLTVVADTIETNTANITNLKVNGTTVNPGSYVVGSGNIGNATTNPVYLLNGKITQCDDICNTASAIIGSRHALAGYSDAARACPATINKDSADDMIVNSRMGITVVGASGCSWCKTVSIGSNGGGSTFSFSGSWHFADDETPSGYKAFDVITLYWNGTFGKIFIS